MGSFWSLAWKWALVAALSATPALLAGQTAAIAVGIHYQLPIGGVLVVSMVFGFLEGLGVVKLALWGETRPRIAQWLERRRTPRSIRFANKWGTWGGLLLGGAAVGQEPMIFALIWLKVPPQKLTLPLLTANVIYTFIYWSIVKTGMAQFETLGILWDDLRLLWELLTTA